MPGASKKRGKLDRQAARGAGQGPAPGAAAPAPPPPAERAPSEPVPYDGPGDNRGGPAPSKPQAGQAGRTGRPPANAPAQSGSEAPRESSPSQASSRPKVDPAKEKSLILNKNVDFPGNAYNLVNQVSSRC